MSGRRLEVYLFLLAVLLNGLNFLPVLDSPYLGDDSWCESSISGAVQLSQTSLFDMCWNAEKDFIRSGRWYPLVIYYYPAFYYLDQNLYKAVTVLMIICNVALFGYFVKLVTFSTSAGLIATLLPPLFCQLRTYHDPILSYYFLMQLEFLFLLASLVFFVWYLRGSKRRFWYLSLLSYTVCLLTYEASYTFWIMHIAVGYLHFGKQAPGKIARAAWPFLLVALVNMGVTLLIRAKFGTHYEGVSLNLSVGDWVATFLKQLVSALPLSYLLTHGFEASREFAGSYFLKDLIAVCAFWAVLWWLVSDHAFAKDRVQTANGRASLILLGLGLWILPAAIVPFSAKYQRELTWGLGYLPVYISCFGVMMVAVFGLVSLYSAAGKLGQRSKFVLTCAIALVGTVVCAITYSDNRTVIEKYNIAEHYHRRIVEDALKNGLLRPVPNGSYLICSPPVRSWDSPAFYRMHSGLTVQVVRPAGFEPDVQLGNNLVETAFAGYQVPGASSFYDFRRKDARNRTFLGYEAQFKGIGWPILAPVVGSTNGKDDTKAFFIRYESKSRGSGYAILGRVVTMKADNRSIQGVSCGGLYVYVAAPRAHSCANVMVTGSWIDDTTLKPGDPFRLTGKDLKLISSGPHGKLYEASFAAGKHLDATSVAATLETTDN
ncbi:MAG: hypothetical protein HY913_09485 [Desulfomonile tiedjei]|nr:hypothetical protein [Desulfomonile tiedjei]